ncbi:MAG: mandelate racemase/muconate lactonizing enzyme family protein [Acidobacteria bacterium]|nr:mandelate racemase/muconate lactonizing enzyme family protein [Acidobacteriota bacterium]
MAAVKLERLEAIPVRIPRDLTAATGTAGTPTTLKSNPYDYRWSETYEVLYPIHFETTLVRLTASNGAVGWGEAQAPLAPEVSAAIVERLLRPAVEGEPFGGNPAEISRLWDRMYSTMRVRGQTGGFMLDAISGVDIALWDLAGKIHDAPVAELLGDRPPLDRLPAYVSGLAGETNAERVEQARGYREQGFSKFKLFFDRTKEDLLGLMDALRAELGDDTEIAVDALWRLREDAGDFGRQLDRRRAMWLECPLLPEDPAAHGVLARSIRTPLALGESYRTRYELAPFFREECLRFLQPDLGRVGLTEGMRLAVRAAGLGIAVVPHVSIAMGPQIAAALHFAAAVPNCNLVEYNPKVFSVANQYLATPIELDGAGYRLPKGPGLGADVLADKIPVAV